MYFTNTKDISRSHTGPKTKRKSDLPPNVVHEKLLHAFL